MTLATLAAALVAVVPASATAARYETRTLASGMHGKDVEQLQRYLAGAGCDSPSASSSFASMGSRPAATSVASGSRSSDRTTAARPTSHRRHRQRRFPASSPRSTPTAFAIPPAAAPQAVKSVIVAGNEIAKTPYKWGGGHQSWTGFTAWGKPGAGRWITVYSNSGHVYMTVAGLRYDTSARSRTGSRWTTEPRSSATFAVTHPPGP